jgi:hypothetical protein
LLQHDFLRTGALVHLPRMRNPGSYVRDVKTKASLCDLFGR